MHMEDESVNELAKPRVYDYEWGVDIRWLLDRCACYVIELDVYVSNARCYKE